jgi:hypothetical protein
MMRQLARRAAIAAVPLITVASKNARASATSRCVDL